MKNPNPSHNQINPIIAQGLMNIPQNPFQDYEQITSESQRFIFTFVKKDGKFVYTNFYGDLLLRNGFSFEESIGKSPDQLFSKHLVSQVIAHYELAWSGEITSYEAKTKTGLWIRTTLMPIKKQDEILEVMGITLNITELKNHELDQLRKMQFIESLFNYTPDSIHILDLNNHITLINKAFEEIYGWTSDEVVGLKLPIIPNFLIEETNMIHRRVEMGEQITNYETTRVRKDGSFVHVNLTLSPIKDTNGAIVGKAAITRDITEKKRMEDHLKEITSLHHLITENMLDVITISNINRKIIYASPSYWRIGGYMFDSDLNPACLIHPDDAKRVDNTIIQMLKTKIPVELEYRIYDKNGQMVYVESQAIPIIENDGEVNKYVIVSRNITERKKTEELLRNSEKIAIVGELAASIAHEIRNPLTSLKGFIQLFQNNSNANKEHLEVMLSEINRINHIVSEMLLLAKPQFTNYRLCNIHKLLEDVISLMQSQALMHNIQFQTDWQANISFVSGEESHLKQVFINIIKNGIEAMQPGGNIYITTELLSDDQILIRFMDEGYGISKEKIKMLGQPFYTTKEKGTGLGLMISKKIIQDHQGEIMITSVLNQGTTVDILLPICTDLQ